MSRVPVEADQLAPLPQDIYITPATQSDGTKTQVMSAQWFCDSSMNVNSEWYGEIWQVGRKRSRDANNRSIYTRQNCSHSGALFLLILLCSEGNITFRNRRMPADVWKVALGFIFGFSQLEQTEALGNYVIAIKRPLFFSTMEIDLSFATFVVDAVMRGEEDMVMKVLRANPNYLLQYAPVKNSVGVESIGSPLQAAIMADDAQMAEKMHQHFKRLPNGDEKMQEQILQIYTESLRMYYKKQAAVVEHFTALKSAEIAIDEAALTTATERRDAYEAALRSDNMLDIFNAHMLAQEHNAFDFQPYIDAICNAPEAELDEVMELINASTLEATQAAIAKGVSLVEIGFIKDGRAYTRAEVQAMPLSELTLIQKLNRFREKLTQHMQQEIIFNPHHILAGLTINETTWDTLLDAQDPQYKKRSIIYSQLVGRTQGIAAEPVKQDIRQGTYHLKEGKQFRSRPSHFNGYVKGGRFVSVVDLTLVDSAFFEGLGFKFAASCSGGSYPGRGRHVDASFFQNLCRAKTASLENLFSQLNYTRLTIP